MRLRDGDLDPELERSAVESMISHPAPSAQQRDASAKQRAAQQAKKTKRKAQRAARKRSR